MGLRVLHLPAQHPADHRGGGRIRRASLVSLIAGACAAALWLAPVPPPVVERTFSTGWYPPWQRVATTLSNLAPFALFDLMLVAALLWLVRQGWLVWRATRRARARTAVAALLRALGWAAVLAVWFLGSWGLNYRRPPLSSRIQTDRARATPARVRQLAETAVAALNGGYAEAHASSWPTGSALVARLAPVFDEGAKALGVTGGIVPGRPKPTLLGPYFRAAGVAGFTNPFQLEVMLTPDALPVEQPALLAHEWGHLAGFAHEAEAGFAGWVACMQGDVQLRYSAWLDLLPRLLASLPAADRATLTAAIADGPRSDYRAIDERLARVRPLVRDAAWQGYDRFLHANRVAEGVRSYDGVVGLVASTRFDERWRPRPTSTAGGGR